MSSVAPAIIHMGQPMKKLPFLLILCFVLMVILLFDLIKRSRGWSTGQFIAY